MENIEKEVMNEFQARDYIINKGKAAKTPEDIKALLDEVLQKFNYDYGVAPRSVAGFCVAAAHFLACAMGLTGFQASFITWDFILGFSMTNNKCGLKMVDFDQMLYPQYGYKFEKTISASTWKSIQEEAKKKLDKFDSDEETAAAPVVEHWRAIVAGNVPFGYSVEEDS